MNVKVRQLEKKQGFTIIELLTVMSIIVILFGLLVPAMNLVKVYSKTVKQQAQFHAIDAGLQLFHGDFQGYPDSTDKPIGGTYVKYPGGMKLTEAMVGQDKLGFHPASVFDRNDTQKLYPKPFNPDTDPNHMQNLRSRKGPYLTVEKANINALPDYYFGVPTDLGNQTNTERQLVISDEFPRVRNNTTGRRMGMPVLYYKANVSNYEHDYTKKDLGKCIYNSDDSQLLVDLPLPWEPSKRHPMATDKPSGEKGPAIFYDETTNPKIVFPQPNNKDTYILMSAGQDGLYGTPDDVFNFEKE